MASTPSGTVVQNGLNGGSAIFTDTGSYGTVSSRILTVYDYLGNVVSPSPFNMGSSLTQVFNFPLDAWFKFVCVVTDNVSGSPWTTTIYWVADGFYWDAYLNQFNSTNCGCQGNNFNMEVSQLNLNAALRFNLAGEAGAAAAQACIVAANYFINQSIVAQYS